MGHRNLGTSLNSISALTPDLRWLLITLSAYLAIFVAGEIILFFGALASIHDSDGSVHQRYKKLMLIWVYLFTLRFTRVLPRDFFEEGDDDTSARINASGAQSSGRRRKRKQRSGRHRQQTADPPTATKPPASIPQTSHSTDRNDQERIRFRSANEEDLRNALFVLLKYAPRMIDELEENVDELKIDRDIVNTAIHDLTQKTRDSSSSDKPESITSEPDEANDPQ